MCIFMVSCWFQEMGWENWAERAETSVAAQVELRQPGSFNLRLESACIAFVLPNSSIQKDILAYRKLISEPENKILFLFINCA